MIDVTDWSAVFRFDYAWLGSFHVRDSGPGAHKAGLRHALFHGAFAFVTFLVAGFEEETQEDPVDCEPERLGSTADPSAKATYPLAVLPADSLVGNSSAKGPERWTVSG